MPSIPGSGNETASASTALRSRGERARQGLIESLAWARRHTPTTSPATRTAPGQTRGRPERAASACVGHEELAVAALEEEPGVAAREEARAPVSLATESGAAP